MSTIAEKAKTIFHEAVAIKESAERAEFLDDACGPSIPLRQRVDRLIDAHGKAVPKVIDFGVAKALSASLPSSSFD